MAKKGVVAVVGRAVVDQQYRERFYRNPSEAMAGYDLSGEEKQALAGIDRREMDKFADSVNFRLRSWYINWAVNPS
ncbi:MAG: Os1348 family NHLP clan protein [Thermoleophilia bacterium]